jgi:hypothetical protein
MKKAMPWKSPDENDTPEMFVDINEYLKENNYALKKLNINSLILRSIIRITTRTKPSAT